MRRKRRQGHKDKGLRKRQEDSVVWRKGGSGEEEVGRRSVRGGESGEDCRGVSKSVSPSLSRRFSSPSPTHIYHPLETNISSLAHSVLFLNPPFIRGAGYHFSEASSANPILGNSTLPAAMLRPCRSTNYLVSFGHGFANPSDAIQQATCTENRPSLL